MKSTFILCAIHVMAFAATNTNAATVILIDESFESGLASWTTTGNGRHYVHLTTNQPPSPNNLLNYASDGTGAANLPGSPASTLTIPTALALATGGFTNITISFKDQFYNGSTTRRAAVEYSDNGGTNWVSLGRWDSGDGSGANNVIRTSSVTLTPGSGSTSTGTWNNGSAYTGAAFTDNTLFRFTFSSNSSTHQVFIDDVVISGESTIPEPTTALLSGLGLLALFRRRR